MTIDIPDTPILEQIEKLPQGMAIEEIRDSVKLSLHAENLTGQKAKVEKVCANSEIREERVFSKEDIAKLIILFAMANKLEMKNLKVTRIINDEKGTLLVLDVEFPNPDGGYQLICYTLKGRHDQERHDRVQSGTTNLDRTFWDKDDMPEGGGIIAEYLEGKWNFKS